MKRSSSVRVGAILAAGMIVGVFGVPAWAGESREGTLAASKEPGWPQWRGPRRDGISDETALAARWPDGGPKLLWTATGVGRGYSAPVIADDTVFVTGDVGEELAIFAFARDGRKKWRSANGASWKRSHPGARSSPTYDGGRLYHMNAHGRVACIDAGTGGEIWSAGVLERFEGKNITWGLSESLLLDGDRVLATPAGAKGLMVALDKATGETLWACEPIAGEEACYSSPILIDFGGRRQAVNAGSRHVFAVDPERGTLLWSVPHADPENVIAPTPVLHGDSVFVTNTSRSYGAIYRVRIDSGGGGAEKVWTKEVTFSHGGLVCAGGRLYGANVRRDSRSWVRVDPVSGAVEELEPDIGPGAVAYAGGRLYCLDQTGVMALVDPSAKGAVTGRFRLAEGKDAWAHPVVCGGRLWLRFHETLYCYAIGG